MLSIEARDIDTKLLSALESNNTLARCWFRRNVLVTTFGSWGAFFIPQHVASSGWPLVLTVPGLMTYLMASLTLDSARLCVRQIAFHTPGMVSSIPTVFNQGGSIIPEGFLPSILLLVVIIVAVVAVMVVVVVVSEGSSIIKLSFVIIGSLHRIVL
ncbi:hypothetical protein Tco_1402240 [Tanacetum coccineum]